MESRRKSLTYLDTHAAIWLCTDAVPLSRAARRALENDELRISPAVLFELQLLREIGRVNSAPAEFQTILRRDFSVSVCTVSFLDVVEASCTEAWTRDPFDRIIVAQARAGRGHLVSKDTRIRENFPGAIW